MTAIFTNETGNATSLIWPGEFDGQSNDQIRHTGGPVQISLAGSFTDETVEVQIQLAQNDLDFVTLLDTDLTAPDVNRMELASGSRLKFVITGATTATNSISVDIMEFT